MSLSRSMRRQFERKAAKKSIESLYQYAGDIQKRQEVRYQEKEDERTLFSFSCILAMCCRVLCRDFGWGKIPDGPEGENPSNYYRLARFSRNVAEEVNNFEGFNAITIKEYLDMVYKECGVRFEYK